jgi:hypothetical protein
VSVFTYDRDDVVVGAMAVLAQSAERFVGARARRGSSARVVRSRRLRCWRSAHRSAHRSESGRRFAVDSDAFGSQTSMTRRCGCSLRSSTWFLGGFLGTERRRTEGKGERPRVRVSRTQVTNAIARGSLGEERHGGTSSARAAVQPCKPRGRAVALVRQCSRASRAVVRSRGRAVVQRAGQRCSGAAVQRYSSGACSSAAVQRRSGAGCAASRSVVVQRCLATSEDSPLMSRYGSRRLNVL